MIAFLAAVAVFFSPVIYDKVHPSFDLHGVSITNGEPERTDGPPVLMHDEDGDSVAFSFISPVAGVCIVGEVVNKDGADMVLPIAAGDEVAKGSTQIGRAHFAPAAALKSVGATTDGYTFVIICGDPEHPKDTAVYSTVYHAGRS